MDIQKQNPFSLYDFLGYFIPGAFLAYTLYFVRNYINAPTPLFDDVVQKISFGKPEIYLPFVIFSYVLGHLLSFLSSITVEQYAIWQFGYPSKFLLGVRSPGYFTINNNKKWLYKIIRLVVGFFILPVALFDLLLGKLLGMRFFYTNPLDSLLVDVINKKVRAVLRNQAKVSDQSMLALPIEHDFFRYIDHYALENAPNHVPKMQNYVALYGFLRTITLIFIFYFWIMLIHVCRFRQVFTDKLSTSCSLSVLALLSILAYILFMAFVKFYRRYSLESLMATTVVYQVYD